MKLGENKRCPFLKCDNYCVIHSNLGEEYLSNVCTSFPRVTNKIDGKFFLRNDNEEKGYIVFQVSDLDWTADLVMSMQDKLKVISPLELKEKVKLRIKKMSEIYKGDT